MKNTEKIEELKKELKGKFEGLSKLQREILSVKKMIAASLIKRHLGTKEHKRKSHAFYLSVSKNGKTKLKYVSLSEVKLVETQVMEWKNYQQRSKQWRALTKVIWRGLKQLGKIQTQWEQQENGTLI